METLKQVSTAKHTEITVTDRKLKTLRSTTDKAEREVVRIEKANHILKGKYDDEAEKYISVVEAKKTFNMKDRAEFRVVTVDLTHHTALGMVQIKLEHLVIAESNLKSTVTRLEGDVRKLKAKGKGYDKLFLQGIKNMMQMKAYGERADIR